MILSASRRTDIPAWFGGWMSNRLRAGEVLIKNPYDPGRLTRLRFSPETVDCIVFWTKYAAPMLERLPEVDSLGYRYYFTHTLTAYGPGLEARLPDTPKKAEAFLRLSDRLGPERVDWRYDPVILDETHPVEWHLEKFGGLCERLRGHTARCILSFVDFYAKNGRRFLPPGPEEIRRAAAGLSKIAAEYRLPLFACAEQTDLSGFSIRPAACIDKGKIEALLGFPLEAKKDPGQRPACGCVESVDVGAYDSCPGGCAYCYAVSGEKAAQKNLLRHSPDSPMLIGSPRGDERITERRAESLGSGQLSLF